MEQPLHEKPVKVVCMDCSKTIVDAPPNAIVSHGLCARCFDKRMADVDRVTARRACQS
jgi:hypothetical protein